MDKYGSKSLAKEKDKSGSKKGFCMGYLVIDRN